MTGLSQIFRGLEPASSIPRVERPLVFITPVVSVIIVIFRTSRSAAAERITFSTVEFRRSCKVANIGGGLTTRPKVPTTRGVGGGGGARTCTSAVPAHHWTTAIFAIQP